MTLEHVKDILNSSLYPVEKFQDWRVPELRKELFNRYFKWRVTVHDLDHGYYMQNMCVNYSNEQKYWFAFCFGMTYRTPQAFAYTETFENINQVTEEWHKENWKRTSYGTDARYNKGHFFKQVESIRSWLNGKTFEDKILSIIVHDNSNKNFWALYNEIITLYKFGRMTTWITCQALYDLLGLDIDPEEIMLEGFSPNQDSSMKSIWNGLCAYENTFDKMIGAYGNYEVTKKDVEEASHKLLQYTKEAEEFSGFKIDSFRKESIWCLTGDTKISLLDGTEVAIQDLVDKDEFWVYSCKEDGEVVPGRGHSARIMKYVDELVEVTLDNNEKIRCTPEQLWMMRDGSYKKAGDLVSGNSLMPLYRQKHTSGYLEGYEKIKDNRSVGYIFTHHLVANHAKNNIKEDLESKSDDFCVVHHIGYMNDNGVMQFNERDNRPENLTFMLNKEHLSYHAKEWAKHPDKTKTLSDIRLAMSEEITEWMKEAWKDEDYANLQSEKCKNQWKSEESTIRKAVSANWEKPEYREKMASVFETMWASEERKAKATEDITKAWKEDDYRYNIRKSRATNPYRILEINTDNYDEYIRLLKLGRSEGKVYKCCSIMNKKEFQFYIIEGNIDTEEYFNHKVVSVERIPLEEEIPVYDITVDSYHNFALTAGTFVHNCQYKRLFNEKASKEWPGHASSDATSRYLYYRENWPEIDWSTFRRALRAQPSIIAGLVCPKWFNEVFGETGLMLNLHEMFDDMPNGYELFEINPNQYRVNELWTDDNLIVPKEFTFTYD